MGDGGAFVEKDLRGASPNIADSRKWTVKLHDGIKFLGIIAVGCNPTRLSGNRSAKKRKST